MSGNYTLALNSTNVVGSGNNTYKFNFASGGFQAKDSEIAIGSLTIPYSWFNVSSAYGNNTFSITVPSNGLDTKNTQTFTLPNGFYQVSDINNYVQLWLYNNNYYLNNASGQPVYYINFSANTTYYRVDILFTAVPTSTTIPSGYSLPSGTTQGWSLGLPSTSKTIQLTLPSNGPNAILGLTAGTYPSVTTSTYTQPSNITPVGSSINALLCHCNLVNNHIVNPSDILDLIPINSTFGSNINYQPPFSKFIAIRDGNYSSLQINFTDQNNTPLNAQDSNIGMTLLIRQKQK